MSWNFEPHKITKKTFVTEIAFYRASLIILKKSPKSKKRDDI